MAPHAECPSDTLLNVEPVTLPSQTGRCAVGYAGIQAASQGLSIPEQTRRPGSKAARRSGGQVFPVMADLLHRRSRACEYVDCMWIPRLRDSHAVPAGQGQLVYPATYSPAA